jgi:hypothetical protein
MEIVKLDTLKSVGEVAQSAKVGYDCAATAPRKTRDVMAERILMMGQQERRVRVEEKCREK